MKALGESGLYRDRDSIITEYFIEGYECFGNQAWSILQLVWEHLTRKDMDPPPVTHSNLSLLSNIGYSVVTMGSLRKDLGWEF
jgi:hypothetical protein